MGTAKKQPLEKKVPLNLSVKRRYKMEIEIIAKNMGVKPSTLGEAIISQWISDYRK